MPQSSAENPPPERKTRLDQLTLTFKLTLRERIQRVKNEEGRRSMRRPSGTNYLSISEATTANIR